MTRLARLLVAILAARAANAERDGLDVERLARAVMAVGPFAGDMGEPVWFEGSAHEVAVAIAREYAVLASQAEQKKEVKP